MPSCYPRDLSGNGPVVPANIIYRPEWIWRGDIRMAKAEILGSQAFYDQYLGNDDPVLDYKNIQSLMDEDFTKLVEVRQELIFKIVAKQFSVTPIHEGVCTGNDPNEVRTRKLKAAVGDFTQYCTKPNHVAPEGDKIGICCGPASGILVLDVDNREEFEKFCADNGISMQMDTLTVQSSDEHYHLYFQYPDDGLDYGCRAQGKSGCGFDVRGNGGYVIGPGSIHPVSKTYYEIINPAPIADAPEWLKNWTLHRSVTVPTENIAAVHPQATPPTVHAPVVPAPQPRAPIPAKTQTLLQANPPVGDRSEVVMSAVNSLLQQDLSFEAVWQIVLASPVGEVARQKGPAWLNRTLLQGMNFVADNPAASKKLTSQDLVAVIETLQFYHYKPEGSYYALMSTEQGQQHLFDIESDTFSSKLLRSQVGKVKNGGTLKELQLALLDSRSYIEEHAQPIERICRFGVVEGRRVLNLANGTEECILIVAQGYFRSARPLALYDDEGLLPIDDVTLGCTGTNNLEMMFDLLCITKETDRHYIAITLTSYLFKDVQTPFLFFVGKQGNGKTTLAEAIKNVFDPCKDGGGMSVPEDTTTLALLLSQSGILFFDNFTTMPKKVQNMLCQAFTNGFFSKRKMYSDKKMLKLPLECPVIMAALEVPEKFGGDLASRSAFIKVEHKRDFKAASEVNQNLNTLYPAVRGELCYLASQVLPIMGNYAALGMKRHGDFDKLGQAYCEVTGLGAEYYKTIMEERIKDDTIAQIRDDSLEGILAKVVLEKGHLVGTPTEILSLMRQNPAMEKFCRTNEARLGMTLNDAPTQAALAALGITIIKGPKPDFGQLYLIAHDSFFRVPDVPDLDSKEMYLNNSSRILEEYQKEHDTFDTAKVIDAVLKEKGLDPSC